MDQKKNICVFQTTGHHSVSKNLKFRISKTASFAKTTTVTGGVGQSKLNVAESKNKNDLIIPNPEHPKHTKLV